MKDRVSGDCIAARQHLSQNLHAMNIEDEEVEREEFQPKVVGRGLVAQFENPEDQQWHLADSGSTRAFDLCHLCVFTCIF